MLAVSFDERKMFIEPTNYLKFLIAQKQLKKK